MLMPEVSCEAQFFAGICSWNASCWTAIQKTLWSRSEASLAQSQVRSPAHPPDCLCGSASHAVTMPARGRRSRRADKFEMHRKQ